MGKVHAETSKVGRTVLGDVELVLVVDEDLIDTDAVDDCIVDVDVDIVVVKVVGPVVVGGAHVSQQS